jgi:hypothetical protein
MNARRWTVAGAVVVFASAVFALLAQQSPSPTAPAGGKSVRISFLPPPIEGTLSLGIYDRAGKLVRVLRREADLDEFEIGQDSLSTSWDGKNDAGESVPAGKYHARGYAVGDVEVEGVGYFFNDWVTSDDSPRVTKIAAIGADDDGFTVTATLAAGGSVTLVCESSGAVKRTRNDPPDERRCDSAAGLPGVVDPVDCAPGKNQTLWVIDRASNNSTEVKQFSAGKELLRRLAISADDPQPRQIAASRTDERVFLLEENASTQRVRALTLVGTNSDAGQAVSDWKVEFEKKIVAHADFGIEGGKPVVWRRGGDAVEKAKIRLTANPLQDDKAADVELMAGFDGNGALLKTADGLPLHTVSETPGLKRVVLAKSGDKSLDLFQDDGAVVEQFRVGNLDQMMAFDAGEFELK